MWLSVSPVHMFTRPNADHTEASWRGPTSASLISLQQAALGASEEGAGWGAVHAEYSAADKGCERDFLSLLFVPVGHDAEREPTPSTA